MFKRILLCTITLLCILLSVYLALTLSGLKPTLELHHLSTTLILSIATLWSLLYGLGYLHFSTHIAKATYLIRVLDTSNAAANELILLDLVKRLAESAALTQQPTLGIYQSSELNAFTTLTKSQQALILISNSTLLNTPSSTWETILAREIFYLQHGHQSTRLLLNGMILALPVCLSRACLAVLKPFLKYMHKHSLTPALSTLITSMLTRLFAIIFGLYANLFVYAYLRRLQYQADIGIKKNTGMIQTLDYLQRARDLESNSTQGIDAVKLTHQGSYFQLFASHPTLSNRIRALMHAPSI